MFTQPESVAADRRNQMTSSPARHASDGPVLVLWGDPPNTPIVDVAGRSLHKRLAVTGQNRTSFEAALRNALAKYFKSHVDVPTAKLIHISSAADFVNVVRNEKSGRLVYYGHALWGTNALLPSLGKNVQAFQIVQALKTSQVREFDILGCETASLAAELSISLPGVRIGYLQGWRQDNFEVDPATLRIKKMTLDPIALHHFPKQSS